ncbi:syncollin-like [Spea bombifrons]|uniref:syncollin-like n=1 Tax=Spea bombifrons TaxID=233779 RepID=UPI00234A745E|nr:syncollin-like [Spea bombifrons]
MRTLSALLLLPLFFWGAPALCPSPSDLVNDYGEKLCARMFEHSNHYFDQSCGGNFLDAKNGDDFPYMPLGWGNKISSLVVANRCTLKVWSKAAKLGNNRSFSAGVVYQLKDYSNGLFGDWNDAIQAYFCTCS